MFILRLDKSLRVACGVGLLGLLVVQEKLWPWLLTAPDPPKLPVAAPGPTGQTPGDKPPNPRLPYILPDTPFSRWPAGCFDQTLRRAAGDRDGVVSCGQQYPKSGTSASLPAADADARAWHYFQCLSSAVGVGDTTAPPLGVNAAVRTSISRTGPPQVA